MTTLPLRKILNPRRPLTYGIVQAGPHVEGGVPYIRPVDMRATSGVLDESALQCTSPDIAHAYERASLRQGDVVLSIGPSFGKVMVVPESLQGANLTQGTARLAPGHEVSGRWLYWVLQARPTVTFWEAAAAGGTFKALNLGPLGETPVRLVAADEQRRIADFLDDRVSRIDRIIAARREQINLLTEERRAVAERLVWQGLDSREPATRVIEPAPPSPTRWPRMPNRYLMRESADISTSGAEELLSVSHLTGITPRANKAVTMFIAESLVGYKVVHVDDLVINTLWAWMGALGVSEVNGIVSPAYGVYRPLEERDFLPAYFHELYRSSAYVCEMTRHSKGVWSSRLRLYPEAFLSLAVAVPPVSEQRRIVHEIQLTVGGNASRVYLLTRSIDLLTEYKSSMITAAVTGELDVTTAGSNIPGRP